MEGGQPNIVERLEFKDARGPALERLSESCPCLLFRLAVPEGSEEEKGVVGWARPTLWDMGVRVCVSRHGHVFRSLAENML